MSKGKKILLVEGEGDKAFFRSFCRAIGLLDIDFTVATPKEFDVRDRDGNLVDGKTAAFGLLPELAKQLADGSITHLGVVLDADYNATHGLGYQGTINKTKEKIQAFGFLEPEEAPPGISFRHNDGLRPFGLWIMPDNASEGMFEDWVKKAAKPEESPLFGHAVNVVRHLPSPRRFKDHHVSKAEVATWLAWQKIPGQGVDAAIECELLDMDSELAKGLSMWLKRIFE